MIDDSILDDTSGYKQQAYGIMFEATPELIARVDAAHIKHSQVIAEYLRYDTFPRPA